MNSRLTLTIVPLGVAIASLSLRLATLSAQESFESPAPYPHGLTTDGIHLWISGYETDEIHKLDGNGNVVDSFPFTFGSPRGLALANAVLHVATGTQIYRLDPNTGAYLSHFASPDPSDPSHQGLAYGDGKLWLASRGSDARIFGLDSVTGQLLVDFAAPGSNPRGLTFHNGSLWNLDSTSDEIYELAPENGAVLSSHPIPLRNPRGLTYHNGSFLQADSTLDHLMRFDYTSPYSDVYVAHSQWSIPGTQLWIPFLSSHPLYQSDSSIERILVYQHGVSDNACEYFIRARHATSLAGELSRTLVLTIQYLDDEILSSAPASELVYWTGSRFWGGLSASSSAPYPRSERVSSFSILDEMLTSLVVDETLFPNLTDIVISGHSGGGQFANRYAATSSFQDTLLPQVRNIAVRYIVMNPGNYIYFNNLRYDPSTLDLANGVVDFILPSSPVADYNEYGFGLEDLYSYPSQVGSSGILSQYPGRTVVYLHGDADTDTVDIDNRPESILQGVNRYERGLIYYEHLKDHFGDSQLPGHTQDVVPGVGHDGGEMIVSEMGQWYHFSPSQEVLPEIHCADINLAVRKAGKRYSGRVTVSVVDSETGQGVKDAVVTGEFSGAFSGQVSGTTNRNGEVKLNSSTKVPLPLTYSFEVTGITHSDYSYNPADNVETSDSGSF